MDDGFPDEDLVACLSNPRRRYAVWYLQQHSNPVPVATLAAEITAWEQDTSTTTVSQDAVERVRIALHHNHLPRLEAAGIVEHDTEREQVEATDCTRMAERLRRQLVAVDEQFERD